MKLCLICDLHLPAEKKAVQYDVLLWICKMLRENQPALILTVGDFTADGSLSAANAYTEALASVGIPHILIAGNSDLRTPETREIIHAMESPAVSRIGNYAILALHDGTGTVPEKERSLLHQADAHTIVIRHHPPEDRRWISEHPDTAVFYGHLHTSWSDGNSHSLQSADPDKAIGESPCISWYDTETKVLSKSHFDCPLPPDLTDYLGISCFFPLRDIPWAAEHHLHCIELRPHAVSENREVLSELIRQWRDAGGVNLSLHAPNVKIPENQEEWDAFLQMAQDLHADRVTIHVPDISIRDADQTMLERCAAFTASCIDRLPENCTAGIENMHMKPGETPDDRGFGYPPEEAISYMNRVRRLAHRPTGFNLDTGHARNNAPYSWHAPLGTWYAQAGPEAVGYHIHQVILKDGVLQNHKPITSLYGPLISYASFFYLWKERRIRHVPVILELRPDAEHEMPYLESIPLLMGKTEP